MNAKFIDLLNTLDRNSNEENASRSIAVLEQSIETIQSFQMPIVNIFIDRSGSECDDNSIDDVCDLQSIEESEGTGIYCIDFILY